MAVGKKTGGRSKGTPNRISADLRDMIAGALSDVGGREYLAKQARENPSAFLTLIGKTIPKEITGPNGKDFIPTKILIELVGA